MKFKLSEQSLVKFQVLDSKGRLIYTTSRDTQTRQQQLPLGRTRHHGRDGGPDHRGEVLPGLVARDAAGNTKTSSRYRVTIRSYEIVKTGRDTAKVVPR